VLIEDLDLAGLPRETIHKLWLRLASNGLGQPECVPVMVARGGRKGPTVGITVALHGDELNGLPVVHRLFERLDCRSLRGNVVAVPVVNLPGFHGMRRRYFDGLDLNHRFPGRPDGDVASVVAHRLMARVIGHCDVLLDLHTASFGRENTLYVRADMSEERTARMAFLQRPQIIVHNPPADGTLRGAAAELGIPAITVEIGDANRFQERYIKRTLVGIRAVLMELGCIPRRPVAKGPPPLICRQSRWLYAEAGGLQTVIPALAEIVGEGEVLARRVDVFGDLIAEVRSPMTGVVVGRSTHPVARSGSRIVHLGELADETDTHIHGVSKGRDPVTH
jgi:hypothetical protein